MQQQNRKIMKRSSIVSNETNAGSNSPENCEDFERFKAEYVEQLTSLRNELDNLKEKYNIICKKLAQYNYSDGNVRINDYDMLGFLNNVRVGETVRFGRYFINAKGDMGPILWQVLEVKDGKALLISKYAIESICYPKEEWRKSSIRNWLNGFFLRTAFLSIEKDLIIDTAMERDCLDKIFILDKLQVEHYFRQNERVCRTVMNPSYSNFKDEKGIAKWWVLGAAAPLWQLAVDLNGALNMYVNCFDPGVFVRPALWVKVEQ